MFWAAGLLPECPAAIASVRDLVGGPPRRLPRFIDRLVGRFFSACPRLAFAAQIFELIVRQVFDADQ